MAKNITVVSYFHHPKCCDGDLPWPFKHWISIRLCFVACQCLACKRSLRPLIEIVELLEKRGIGFRSLTEAIDTINSEGKLVFHIFASLAKFGHGIIRERTKAGLEVARARGKLGDRPPALLQTDLVVVKALLCDPNISVEEAARRVGVSSSALYRHLPSGRSGLFEDT